MDLIKPKTITVKDGDGNDCTLTISKFPAMQGLKINALYPTNMVMSSLFPKFTDWKISEELILEIFSFIAVDIGGRSQPLVTMALINNHVGDWEAMARVIWAIMEYNNSFFRNGTISDFFADIALKIQAKISEILTQSSAPSSQPIKQPSTSSEQSTQ